jgi:hypothetical protein
MIIVCDNIVSDLETSIFDQATGPETSWNKTVSGKTDQETAFEHLRGYDRTEWRRHLLIDCKGGCTAIRKKHAICYRFEDSLGLAYVRCCARKALQHRLPSLCHHSAELASLARQEIVATANQAY